MNNMWYVYVYHVTCDSTMTVQIPGEVKDEVSLAGRKSIETVKCVSATLLLCYNVPPGHTLW